MKIHEIKMEIHEIKMKIHEIKMEMSNLVPTMSSRNDLHKAVIEMSILIYSSESNFEFICIYNM